MNTTIYETEQQAMDDYSLIIIRQILNGATISSIVDELVHSHVPRITAKKLVNSIATQIVTSQQEI